jgi:hypothetical protein
MNRDEQERLYREAMAARRAGEVCPLCHTTHSALSACPPRREPPLVRNTDVETSHEAAAKPGKPLLRLICIGLYYDHPDGLVDDDLANLAGYSNGHESYRRRGSDLRDLGWTEWLYDADGAPVRRKTHLNSSARVSVITPLGRAVWETREGTE